MIGFIFSLFLGKGQYLSHLLLKDAALVQFGIRAFLRQISSCSANWSIFSTLSSNSIPSYLR